VADIYGSLITPLLLAVILVVFGVGIWLFVMRRLRTRRQKLSLELQESPSLVEDRAFNRIRIARSEAEILDRAGTPSARGKELVDRAQEAYDTRNFAAAVSLADSAHTTLLKARHSPSPQNQSSIPATSIPIAGSQARLAPTGASGGASAASAVVPGGGGSVALSGLGGAASLTEVETARTPDPKGLPKNRAEAHFQLTVLDSEISRRKARSNRNGTSKEADGLRQQAQAAYDQEKYTEALTLALRGRRRLGTLVETLPPPSNGGPPSEGSGTSSSTDATDAAARASEGERCSTCGFPVAASDRFCRGCGSPRRGVANCPKCGVAGKPGDAFCGACGSPMT